MELGLHVKGIAIKKNYTYLFFSSPAFVSRPACCKLGTKFQPPRVPEAGLEVEEKRKKSKQTRSRSPIGAWNDAIQ